MVTKAQIDRLVRGLKLWRRNRIASFSSRKMQARPKRRRWNGTIAKCRQIVSAGKFTSSAGKRHEGQHAVDGHLTIKS